MAKEVLELEVKTNVSGATSEMKKMNGVITESISEIEELNEQFEIQTEVVNNLEDSLMKMKQQQAVNSDYENSVSGLSQKIREVQVELSGERRALKKITKERRDYTKSLKEQERQQIKNNLKAFRGVQHFQVMGVSLRRIRLMVRGTVPAFKLMFSTIKAGIASTGIGLLVIAIGSVITAMARSSKGAKAFKLVMSGIGKAVDAILTPVEMLGDAILTLFGVESDKTSSTLNTMDSQLASIEASLDKINTKEAEQGVELDANKRKYDDITLSEEERLAALEKNNDITKKNNADRLVELEEEQKVRAEILHRAKGWVLDHERRQVADEESKKSAKNLTRRQKEYNETVKNLAKLKQKMQADDFDYEDKIDEIKGFNVDKEKERVSKQRSDARKWQQERTTAEKKVSGIILKLEQEAALSLLETDKEVELKKLEFKNKKAEEDIKNSKASKKSKDEALLLLEEEYIRKQQEITDKFQDKADEKAEAEAEKLQELRNENLLAAEEDETKREIK